MFGWLFGHKEDLNDPRFDAAKTQRPHVVLQLNEYQAANLRWLLHIALSHLSNEKIELLNTGDWNGEILWELEQQMIDLDWTKHRPNVNDKEWPFLGWFNGDRSFQSKCGDLVCNPQRQRMFYWILLKDKKNG